MTVIFSEVIFEIFRGVEILLYFRNTCFFFSPQYAKQPKLTWCSWWMGHGVLEMTISIK